MAIHVDMSLHHQGQNPRKEEAKITRFYRSEGKKENPNLSEMWPLDKISSVTAEINFRYIISSSL